MARKAPDPHCDGCEWLHPSEELQNLLGDKRPHRCTKLNARVYHGAGAHGPGAHPMILKHPECPIASREESQDG